jgi:hypothetical protein
MKSIEEMALEADVVEEPGTMHKGDVISEADDELPSMTAMELKSAGWVYIYDRVTRERSLCNRNMLPAVLKLKRDGKQIFTTEKLPPPWRGNFKCFLHPDDPNRAVYDQMGLPVCKKSNMPSMYQVEQHMKFYHKAEWAAIEARRMAAEREQDRQERAADRELQRQLLERLVPAPQVGTPEAPLYVSDKPKVGRPRKA